MYFVQVGFGISYSPKAARAAAPINPIPNSGRAAALGVEVGVAVAMTELTRPEAEATAEGSGFEDTAVQISGARVESSSGGVNGVLLT